MPSFSWRRSDRGSRSTGWCCTGAPADSPRRRPACGRRRSVSPPSCRSGTCSVAARLARVALARASAALPRVRAAVRTAFLRDATRAPVHPVAAELILRARDDRLTGVAVGHFRSFAQAPNGRLTFGCVTLPSFAPPSGDMPSAAAPSPLLASASASPPASTSPFAVPGGVHVPDSSHAISESTQLLPTQVESVPHGTSTQVGSRTMGISAVTWSRNAKRRRATTHP